MFSYVKIVMNSENSFEINECALTYVKIAEKKM